MPPRRNSSHVISQRRRLPRARQRASLPSLTNAKSPIPYENGQIEEYYQWALQAQKSHERQEKNAQPKRSVLLTVLPEKSHGFQRKADRLKRDIRKEKKIVVKNHAFDQLKRHDRQEKKLVF